MDAAAVECPVADMRHARGASGPGRGLTAARRAVDFGSARPELYRPTFAEITGAPAQPPERSSAGTGGLPLEYPLALLTLTAPDQSGLIRCRLASAGLGPSETAPSRPEAGTRAPDLVVVIPPPARSVPARDGLVLAIPRPPEQLPGRGRRKLGPSSATWLWRGRWALVAAAALSTASGLDHAAMRRASCSRRPSMFR